MLLETTDAQTIPYELLYSTKF